MKDESLGEKAYLSEGGGGGGRGGFRGQMVGLKADIL